MLIVSGPGNIGKSTSIKTAFGRLLKWNLKEAPTKVTYLYLTGKEVAAVVCIGSVFVGMATRGDSRKEVQRALEFFGEEKCKVIVCATRSQGASLAAAKEFSDERGYFKKEKQKPSEPNVRRHAQANLASAKEIHQWIIAAVQ